MGRTLQESECRPSWRKRQRDDCIHDHAADQSALMIGTGIHGEELGEGFSQAGNGVIAIEGAIGCWKLRNLMDDMLLAQS
ncbi:hypothetical protein ACLOJK_006676 [Asimina triloba]